MPVYLSIFLEIALRNYSHEIILETALKRLSVFVRPCEFESRMAVFRGLMGMLTGFIAL